MATATLSSKGRITIPVVVREKLGLTTGDRLEFIELSDGKFAIVPSIEDVRSLKGIVRKPSRPVTIEQIRRIVGKRVGGR